MATWQITKYKPEVIYDWVIQTRTCSSIELDCVAKQDIDGDDCLEHCEGTIVDVVKLSSSLNELELAGIISDYEKFKYPYSGNLTYPVKMNGKVEQGR